jgi:hypothetical protein
VSAIDVNGHHITAGLVELARHESASGLCVGNGSGQRFLFHAGFIRVEELMGPEVVIQTHGLGFPEQRVQQAQIGDAETDGL